MDATSRFKHKRVIVTRASSRIGRETALSFGREGAEVAVLARRKERLIEVKKEIESCGEGKCHVFPIDLSRAENIPSILNDIQSNMGEP